MTATGQLAFPEMQNGTLLGMPVITSTTVPAGNIYIIDQAEVAMAGGAPTFLASNQATIHEEYVQADVKPIVDGTPTTANPVR